MLGILLIVVKNKIILKLLLDGHQECWDNFFTIIEPIASKLPWMV